MIMLISAPDRTRSRPSRSIPPAKMERPMFLIGQGALARADGLAILAAGRPRRPTSLGVVKDGWNGLSILHTAAARVGGLDLGFVPRAGRPRRHRHGESRRARRSLQSRRRRDQHRARRLRHLSGLAWRSRRRARRRHPAGRGLYRKIRHSTSIRRGACSWPIGPIFRLATRARTGPSCAPFPRRWGIGCRSIRSRPCAARLYAAHPHFAEIDAIAGGEAFDAAKLIAAGGAHAQALRFVSPITDFYLTNPIARASAVMAECSTLRLDHARQAAE